MTDLLWPGDARAGELCGDRALVEALVRVEVAWFEVLGHARVAPAVPVPPAADLATVTDAELAGLATDGEAGGNPVIPLLALLRARLRDSAPDAARWLHRGLTSQDALDTALVLLVRDALDAVLSEVASQVRALADLCRDHRDTLMAGRTLTQHAVPTTFGLLAATWLRGVLAAGDDLRRARDDLPAQVGGAAGTLAAVAQLTGSPGRAREAATDLARRLDLRAAAPWHTQRRTITRTGDALVAAHDAWGHLADDVLLRARPEVGELSEGSAPGRGGSSTMPHKRNPVLAVLLRRSALGAPALGSALHGAAAAAVDERPDGGWHAEWEPLRTLARRTVVDARQATELLTHLVVDDGRMRATADAAAEDLLAESRSLSELTAALPVADLRDYLGAAGLLVDDALAAAARYLEAP